MKSFLFSFSFVDFGFLFNTYAKNLKSFIPKGYILLDSASEDLNKDGIKDLIVVLKII